MNKPIDQPLMDYLTALENQSNPVRGLRVEGILRSLGLKPLIHENRRLKIRNIIVDFNPGDKRKRLLFTAHFDAVMGSPGANDNASGVAVLLGLCRELRKTPRPVRIVFFDREEAWFKSPFLRLGLLGSLSYVYRQRLKDISAVFNL